MGMPVVEDDRHATIEDAAAELTAPAFVLWRLLCRVPDETLAGGRTTTAKHLRRHVRSLNRLLGELDRKGYVELELKGKTTVIAIRRIPLLAGFDRAARLSRGTPERSLFDPMRDTSVPRGKKMRDTSVPAASKRRKKRDKVVPRGSPDDDEGSGTKLSHVKKAKKKKTPKNTGQPESDNDSTGPRARVDRIQRDQGELRNYELGRSGELRTYVTTSHSLRSRENSGIDLERVKSRMSEKRAARSKHMSRVSRGKKTLPPIPEKVDRRKLEVDAWNDADELLSRALSDDTRERNAGRKGLSDAFLETFRHYRAAVGRPFAGELSSSDRKRAVAAALACAHGGFTPAAVIAYWHVAVRSFTDLEVLSLRFLSPSNVDSAIAAGCKSGKSKGGKRATDETMGFLKGELHPGLRGACEDAGVDVSEWKDKHLLTVQAIARDLARGRPAPSTSKRLMAAAKAACSLFDDEEA